MSSKRTSVPGTADDAPARGAATIRVWSGHPLPLGVTETHLGLNFAVFSRHATAITLVLFASGRHEPVCEFALDPVDHRTGDIWHIELEGIDDSLRFGWRADRQPVPRDAFNRFDRTKVLVDPYARALTDASQWGVVSPREGELPDDTFNRSHLIR